MAVSLVSSTALVQTPYITVAIGNYEFGCYNTKAYGSDKFPNYIKSLEITKINGRVNQYSLHIEYPITESNDPNFFEKVFSSVSASRSILFTYGDLSAKNYIYRKEKAMITKVTSDFGADSAVISYNVSAVSTGTLGLSGSYPFIAPGYKVKPSDIIKKILKQNSKYGLQDLFPGMRNMTLVNQYNLIPGNDVAVIIETKTNVTVLDYIQYLVSCMKASAVGDSVLSSSFYVMTFVDDTTDMFGGAYFKIVQVNRDTQYPDAYELYVGYPASNAVRNFKVDNSENYSIYYDYQNKLHPEKYVQRINYLGEVEDVFAPIMSSGNPSYKTTEAEKSWWSKVSQYPITVSLEIKGLLRPAILMSYVRLYVLFFGRTHINSGIYIITKQSDTINENGYSTTLNMVRVASDSSIAIS